MSVHSPSSSVGWRQRHGQDELKRPVSSALSLGVDHASKIDQSHERCQSSGLSRIERPDFSPLGRADLSVVRERNRRLHVHAAPIMEMLFEQIVKSESLVLLCDAMGTVLHSIGDDDFLSRASKVALAPGANWSESAKGTNAVGTALIDESPTLVHADEHYMHANHFLTCSAAPILDPRGNILGVLDVSGDHRSYHQHTMALVKMSARMIENHWLTDDYRDVLRLHFHSRSEFIGTLMEGILAVSHDGKIVGANRGALEQLGMSGASVRMHSLTSLFGTDVAALIDRFRSPLSMPMQVEQPSGRQFHVYARFNWPVWHSFNVAAESAEATQASPGVAASGGGASAYGDLIGLGAPSGGGAISVSTAEARATEVPAAGRGLDSLLTGDAQVASLIDKVRRVLNRDIPVLVLGETGTGKELLARAMHQDSARSRQPFVAVNCASIPDTLIEAELFGYEEGAFTGARRKGAVGRIVQANGGTLFLDEIGDMPTALQAHLLRVLQERQVVPLGSSKSIAVDVSIICATHRNLREMIAAKTFREDLFYRLNGLAVRLPALRERSDLMSLVRVILERECPHTSYRMSSPVVDLFKSYTWPGNVRQLFNVLRTACVMAGDDNVLTVDHLSDDFLEESGWRAQSVGVSVGASAASGVLGSPGAALVSPVLSPAMAAGTSVGLTSADESRGVLGAMPPMAQPSASDGAAMPPSQLSSPTGPGFSYGQPVYPGSAPGAASQPAGSTGGAERYFSGSSGGGQPVEGLSLDEMERQTIQRTVDACTGNISEAAKRLGISRNTIYRKLRWNAKR